MHRVNPKHHLQWLCIIDKVSPVLAPPTQQPGQRFPSLRLGALTSHYCSLRQSVSPEDVKMNMECVGKYFKRCERPVNESTSPVYRKAQR